MPTNLTSHNIIRNEIFHAKSAEGTVRVKYLKRISSITGNNTIAYATDFLTPERGKPPIGLSLEAGDKNMFDEVTEHLDRSKTLDVIIESPGGSLEAVDAIIQMLRNRFQRMRVIVPNSAKSAATIFALAADEILMSDESELGPIDPQMIYQLPNGAREISPAQSIINQFQGMIVSIASQPNIAVVLAPFLQQYFPSLLQRCNDAILLSKKISEQYLNTWMFKGQSNANQRASDVVTYLASFQNFLTHAKAISMKDAISCGLNVIDLQTNPRLYELVKLYYASVMESFNRLPILKICENNIGHGLQIQYAIK